MHLGELPSTHELSFMVLHSVVHTKSDKSSCVKKEGEKESLREMYKPCPLSHLNTPGRSTSKVGVLVGLSVPESYTNYWTQLESGPQTTLDDPSHTLFEGY